MSTLKVGTVADTSGNNGSTPAAIANGIAKAWVNFNGIGTVTIRASYNVSSITDNGVGDYTVNFTTALVDANYSTVGFSNSVNDQYFRLMPAYLGTYTASAVRVTNTRLQGTGGSTEDSLLNCVSVFR